jgi:hypothetical protein
VEDLRLTAEGADCTGRYGFECVELELGNTGSRTVQVPIVTEGKKPRVAFPGRHCEGRISADADWEVVVTEIGTYQAPTRFIRIDPGATARFSVDDCREGKYAQFRWVLEDRDGRLHVSVPEVADDLARYEQAAEALNYDFINHGRNARYCWVRAGALCNGETPADTEAGRALRACVIRLADANERPRPHDAFVRLEHCMNEAGWFRYEWYELNIGLQTWTAPIRS